MPELFWANKDRCKARLRGLIIIVRSLWILQASRGACHPSPSFARGASQLTRHPPRAIAATSIPPQAVQLKKFKVTVFRKIVIGPDACSMLQMQIRPLISRWRMAWAALHRQQSQGPLWRRAGSPGHLQCQLAAAAAADHTCTPLLACCTAPEGRRAPRTNTRVTSHASQLCGSCQSQGLEHHHSSLQPGAWQGTGPMMAEHQIYLGGPSHQACPR